MHSFLIRAVPVGVELVTQQVERQGPGLLEALFQVRLLVALAAKVRMAQRGGLVVAAQVPLAVLDRRVLVAAVVEVQGLLGALAALGAMVLNGMHRMGLVAVVGLAAAALRRMVALAVVVAFMEVVGVVVAFPGVQTLV